MLSIKSKYVSAALILLLFSIASCKKYLADKPDNSIAVPTHLSDLQALLDNAQEINEQQSPSFGEGSSDDYFVTDETLSSLPVEYYTSYTWNRFIYQFQNDWSKCYQVIYTTNHCLNTLDGIPITPANKTNWEQVQASALFSRSYNFLNLLWIYAKAYDSATAEKDPGIALRLIADLNAPTTRASVAECYAKVISDTRTAIVALPDLPSHTFRPSRAAAYGLLSRAYLSMRRYDSAFYFADQALQLQSALMDYNADEEIDMTASFGSPIKRFNKETIFYTEMNSTVVIIIPYFAKVDSNLYHSYSNTDLRKAVYFDTTQQYATYRGSYAGSNQYFTGIATDEMLLTRAECAARLGKITLALTDLNALLIKRYANTIPYTEVSITDPAALTSYILTERRKELCMRGLRWMDIKRLNAEGANIVQSRTVLGKTYTLEPNASYYALPLPTDIIELTGIKQN